MILYKRNAQDKPIFWSIKDLGENILVNYGLVGTSGHTETLNKKLVKANEINSRIKSKRKEGYKELSELYDNAPDILTNQDLINYLNVYLPKYNTADNNFVLPMLAKTLKDNKPFIKGEFFGQYKINGERCIIGARKVNNLFRNVELTYTSREGVPWNFSFMDEILLPYISKNLLDMMVEEGVCLDGELYLPGYTINTINSFIKNGALPNHYKLQFWCYDLCIDNMSAIKRSELRTKEIKRHVYNIASIDEHLNSEDRFVLLPNVHVDSYNQAVYYRNKFIDLGFEGLVIRNEKSEYQFGKRNSAMFKFKDIKDGLFKIIDIIPEGVRSDLPKFILLNDINRETFECTINLPHKLQKEILINKQMYINHLAKVEYRERSGVKQAPFHAKIKEITDKIV